MFEHLLKDEFDTKRLTAVNGTGKETLQYHLKSQAGMIQPAGDLEEMASGNKVGQMFKLFCGRIDLKVSDRVICGSAEYVVKSIKDFNYGRTPHLEAIIVKM